MISAKLQMRFSMVFWLSSVKTHSISKICGILMPLKGCSFGIFKSKYYRNNEIVRCSYQRDQVDVMTLLTTFWIKFSYIWQLIWKPKYSALKSGLGLGGFIIIRGLDETRSAASGSLWRTLYTLTTHCWLEQVSNCQQGWPDKNYMFFIPMTIPEFARSSFLL